MSSKNKIWFKNKVICIKIEEKNDGSVFYRGLQEMRGDWIGNQTISPRRARRN